MCTVFVLRNQWRDCPLMVLANRDERLSRPWTEPAVLDVDHNVFAPQDTCAGGTWIGWNRRGLFAAITNRLHIRQVDGRRSRGILCLDALRIGSAEHAVQFIAEHVARERVNGFNLLLADGEQVTLLTYGDGNLAVTPLDDGIHIVTSRHDANPPIMENYATWLGAVVKAGRFSWHDFALPARELLADHTLLQEYYAVCKHFGPFGTSSATMFAWPSHGAPQFWFCHGAPCQTPMEAVGWAAGWEDAG